MIIVNVDVLDGNGLIPVVVSNIEDKIRLQHYFSDTKKMLCGNVANEAEKNCVNFINNGGAL